MTHSLPFCDIVSRSLALAGAIVVCAALTFTGLTVSAQDQPPADEPAAATGDTGPAREAFDQKLNEWKELLKELRSIQAKFQVATDAEAPVYEEQWNGLIAKGEAMLPDLRSTGLAAYTASPNTDRVLVRFLAKMMDDELKRDNYEPAYEIAKTLLENEAGVNEAYNAAGVSAFATNDFDAAGDYLTKARELDVLDDTGRGFLVELPTYKKLWEEEKAKREAEAKADDLPRVKFTTTEGDILIELFENEAPETVGNFVSLVEKGFYDGLTFHRVLEHFMAQGGDPSGDGTGGPGYNIFCECYNDGHRNHFRGTLSMAHAGRDTGGSQFFLTFVPTPHLNGKHTAFGRVIDGMDVLSRLHRVDPTSPDSSVEPSKIIKAEVVRKRDHEYVPHKVDG